MKKLIIISLLFFTCVSCEKGYLGLGGVLISKHSNYIYLKGPLPNSCYTLDWSTGNKANKITGKPFMVLKYDRTSQDVLDILFGFSEVTQTSVGPGAVEDPTFSASILNKSSNNKLDLKDPCVLIADWPTLGGGGKIIKMSFSSFSFLTDNTQWIFNYQLSWDMTGGASNLDISGYKTDNESSIQLLKL